MRESGMVNERMLIDRAQAVARGCVLHVLGNECQKKAAQVKKGEFRVPSKSQVVFGVEEFHISLLPSPPPPPSLSLYIYPVLSSTFPHKPTTPYPSFAKHFAFALVVLLYLMHYKYSNMGCLLLLLSWIKTPSCYLWVYLVIFHPFWRWRSQALSGVEGWWNCLLASGSTPLMKSWWCTIWNERPSLFRCLLQSFLSLTFS